MIQIQKRPPTGEGWHDGFSIRLCNADETGYVIDACERDFILEMPVHEAIAVVRKDAIDYGVVS